MQPHVALLAGYRLRVNATALWFNIDKDRWNVIRTALRTSGAEGPLSGFDGEEIWATAGLTVSHRASEGRMQSELQPSDAEDTPAVLATLLQVAPRPSAEASPTWLFGPAPFAIAQRTAEPALRVMRAARWLLPLPSAPEVLAAAASAHSAIASGASLRVQITTDVELEFVTTPPETDPLAQQAQITAFERLLGRLGQPSWAEYRTLSRPATA